MMYSGAFLIDKSLLGLLIFLAVVLVLMVIFLGLNFIRCKKAEKRLEIGYQQLKEKEEQYRLAIEGSHNGIWDWDMQTDQFFISPRGMTILEWNKNENYDKSKVLESIHPDDVADFGKAVYRHLKKEEEYFQHECRVLNKSGKIKWILCWGKAVWNEEGKPIRIAGSFTDVTERKKTEERMHYLALYDTLTDLPNKLKFYEELNIALTKAKVENHLVALLCLDLDNFKNVNDSLGHFYGDLLLMQVAGRLKDSVKKGDTVARLGGDEFIIIQKEITKAQEVSDFAEKLMDVFRKTFVLDGREFLITPSIGITVYPFDGDEGAVLLKNVDTAMYSAKKLGKNNYQFFDQIMNIEILERMELENSLRKALEQEEFVIYYQPIVQTDTGKIIGVEALVRWQHPQKGLLSPGQFIKVAEETGLIIPLGNWVLENACKQVKEWRDKGFNDLMLSVNLSPAQLRDDNLITTLARIINECGVIHNRIKLEVTESIAIENIGFVCSILEEIEKLGVGISLDDFGTGFSSLNYLRKLPINNLKIDKSFINKINVGYEEDEIAIAVINLAHAMGLTVTAEGVETREQLSFLQEQNCDFVQGYYFSKPVPGNQLEELLKNT